jgi:hypothetical protein
MSTGLIVRLVDNGSRTAMSGVVYKCQNAGITRSISPKDVELGRTFSH